MFERSTYRAKKMFQNASPTRISHRSSMNSPIKHNENSAELLRRQIIWEKWSGNKPVSDPQLFRYIKSHEVSASGMEIIIPFKPLVWQRYLEQQESIQSQDRADEEINAKDHSDAQTLRSDNRLNKSITCSPLDPDYKESEYCARLNFVNFLHALPLFQFTNSQLCFSKLQSSVVQKIVSSPQSIEIISRGQQCHDVFIIRWIIATYHW